jgi:hypothetical protein
VICVNYQKIKNINTLHNYIVRFITPPIFVQSFFILSATPIIIYILYTHPIDTLIATRYITWPSSLGLFYYLFSELALLYFDWTYVFVFLISYTFNVVFCCD